MIVIRVNNCWKNLSGWIDRQAIRMLFDNGSEFTKLTSQIRNPIRFFESVVGNPTNAGRAIGYKCDNRKRLDCVTDVTHVYIDPAQTATIHSHRIVIPSNRTSHLLKYITELYITL